MYFFWKKMKVTAKMAIHTKKVFAKQLLKKWDRQSCTLLINTSLLRGI